MRFIFWLSAFLVVCQLTIAESKPNFFRVPLKKNLVSRGPASVGAKKTEVQYYQAPRGKSSAESRGLLGSPIQGFDRSGSSKEIWKPTLVRF